VEEQLVQTISSFTHCRWTVRSYQIWGLSWKVLRLRNR